MTTEDIVKKIHDIVLADRREKIRANADIVDISTESIQNILHEKLGMRKLSARRMVRLLRVNRMTTSDHCLDMFKRNPKETLRRLVTVDEAWIRHYTPEMKEQSKQWTSPGERGRKKVKTMSSAGKVLATVFLGFARQHLHRLFGEGKHNHGAVLC